MTALRFSLSVLTGLALTLAASADEVRGRIARVDLDKKELTLEGRGPARGRMMTFTLGPKTQVFVGAQPGALSDLAAGGRARIVFEQRDGKQIVQAIHTLGLRQLLGGGAPVPPAAPNPPAAPKDANAVTGTLQRVALTDREVVVIGYGPKGEEKETTIAVPEGTPIKKDDKTIAFEALKEGDKVAVKTEQRKGRLTAVSIQVGQTAAAAGPAPAMPPRRNLIPRLRGLLKMADQLLEMAEEQQKRNPPDQEQKRNVPDQPRKP